MTSPAAVVPLRCRRGWHTWRTLFASPTRVVDGCGRCGITRVKETAA